MSRNKKNKTPFHHYETDKKYEDMYIRLTKTLLLNNNFKTLQNSAKVLYIYMRLWAYPKKEFSYSIGNSKGLMSKNTFLKNVDILEKEGFINIKFRNKYSHMVNIYEFSDRWYKNPK